jgi:hypothetical protein
VGADRAFRFAPIFRVRLGFCFRRTRSIGIFANTNLPNSISMRSTKLIRLELKNALSQSVELFFEEIKKYLSNESKRFNELILLQARYGEAESELDQGTITSENYHVILNRLRIAALNLIDEVEDEDIDSTAPDVQESSIDLENMYNQLSKELLEVQQELDEVESEKTAGEFESHANAICDDARADLLDLKVGLLEGLIDEVLDSEYSQNGMDKIDSLMDQNDELKDRLLDISDANFDQSSFAQMDLVARYNTIRSYLEEDSALINSLTELYTRITPMYDESSGMTYAEVFDIYFEEKARILHEKIQLAGRMADFLGV